MKDIRELLEFNKILEQLSQLAVSDKAKEKLLGLQMFLDESLCEIKMNETTQARRILDSMGNPPISSMQYMEHIMECAEKGAMLEPKEFELVVSFIKGCQNMKRYLIRAEYLDCQLASYGRGFYDMNELKELIELSIRNNQVDSEASTSLKAVRRAIETKKDQIKTRLEKILQSKKAYLADFYIIERSGRYALAVKKEYKREVEGTILDTSRSGGTVFIEPVSVSKLQEDLTILEIEEDNEVRKVLYTLTNEVEGYLHEMKLNMDMMLVLDIAFAKAKLSYEMKAVRVPIMAGGSFEIKQGRHPLLDQKSCVPLDFYIKDNIRGIIVTGPNTGGKTVALKTVGLLAMMAQCGLHIPVNEGSKFRMFNEILGDIGDGQSIEESLSTFSSHIVNITEILKRTTPETLVLLDELGSGTDPAEGMGIAIAILEALRNKNCLLAATTHYPEVKDYAAQAEGFINARMCFDKESLRPLYKLEIGEAGESCAFYIAEKLGFPKELIELASSYTYKQARDEQKRERLDKETLTADKKYKHKTEEGKKENKEGDDKQSKDSGYKTDQVSHGEKVIQEKAGTIRIKPKSQAKSKDKAKTFQIGDSVIVFPEKEKGLVFHLEDDEGRVGVQIKGAKKWVSTKRVKVLVAASELYPSDYDFSIVFDSVANRKAKHKMSKGYQEDMKAEYKNEEETKWQSFQ